MAKSRGRPRNPKISDFAQRLDWILRYLDPYPGYARFTTSTNAIYNAYAKAVAAGSFPIGNPRQIDAAYPHETLSLSPKGESVWEGYLRNENPSKEMLDWLVTLYPDLTLEHLLVPTLEEFFERGEPVKVAKERWGAPVQMYSKQRKSLQDAALEFYDAGGDERYLTKSGHKIPLLLKNGWIRERPLLLVEGGENEHLLPLRQARDRPVKNLPGLNGEFITYRGKIGFPAREKVNQEPQHNGEIFCAESVLKDQAGFVGFEYRLGTYFDYINTSEVLGVELANWLINNPSKTLDRPLPFRGSREDAFELSNRAAYPGINCLTVLLNYSSKKFQLPRNNYFLLHKRDETQMQAQNSVHVIPAGGHQGIAADAIKEDTAMWRTLVREFAEELYDKEDLSRQSSSWIDFLANRDILEIKRLFDAPSPAVKPYLMGFGLDPITLKPEVLCVEVIDWDVARQKIENPEFKFNWEVQTDDPSVTRHTFRPLSRELLVSHATRRLLKTGDGPHLDPLPAGAACMLLANEHFEVLGLQEYHA